MNRLRIFFYRIVQKLKKQISESFFNPILYFLPALVFILVDDFWDENMAWKLSFPVALAVIFYVYFMYKRMFIWHGILAFGYLIIGLITSLVSGASSYILRYIDEMIFILLGVGLLLGQNLMEKVASKTLPHALPMSNNENEFFRVTRVLLSIIIVFIILSLIFESISFQNNEVLRGYLKFLYAGSIVFVGIFETIRVFIVRSRLIKEDWLPVVDESGKVIGSVQYQPDTNNKERLLHPAVRLYFIENGKILLQQRNPNDRTEPLHWDASLSRQVRMTESIEIAVRNATQKLYNIEPNKFIFLTNYIYRGKFSDQYIYLFVLCKTEGMQPKEEELYRTKWWTQKQIEAELGEGVFTERFEKEYEFLKRSGLLEQDGCDCECALKDMLKISQERTTA